MGVEIRFTKWGGKAHWRYPLEPLGTDRFGWWLGGRAGIPLQRGLEDPVLQPHDFVSLVPADGCWIASWNGPGETDISVYVDVTTKPVRCPDAIHAVDLDLDVVRLRDGTVSVLDEDEFAEHQVTYHSAATWPRSLIPGSTQATGRRTVCSSSRLPAKTAHWPLCGVTRGIRSQSRCRCPEDRQQA